MVLGLRSLAFGLGPLTFVLRICARVNVRLEVGIAHRCDLGEIMQVSNGPMIIYLIGFRHVAPVGDAHL